MINTEKFKLLEQFVVELVYTECQVRKDAVTGVLSDIDCQAKQLIPMVRVQNGDYHMIILGIHVPGNSRQFPVNGFKALNELLESIMLKYSSDDIFISGDFNTSASNIKKVVTSMDFCDPMYLTHMYPLCQAVTYDVIGYKSGSKLIQRVEPEPLENMPNDTQQLVKSLYDNLLGL